MSRALWFVAGATTGVYAVVKARRAAEAFTPDGLRDRVSALALGAQLFGDEVRTEMSTRENELRGRLAEALDGTTTDRAVTDARPLQLTRKGND